MVQHASCFSPPKRERELSNKEQQEETKRPTIAGEEGRTWQEELVAAKVRAERSMRIEELEMVVCLIYHFEELLLGTWDCTVQGQCTGANRS